MQVHMRRLVEVTKDIDGFKENMVYNYNNNIIGGICHGTEERVLQTDDYWYDYEYRKCRYACIS